MDKIIVTVMLIIGGIVASFAVFNSVYPAVERGGQALSDSAGVVSERLTSRIEIIQVSGNAVQVDAWVKNVGSSRIGAIRNSDIFFGQHGAITRIPFGEEGSPLPYWSYELEGGHEGWGITVTNRITIYLAGPLEPGAYLFKVILPNGISAETSFSRE